MISFNVKDRDHPAWRRGGKKKGVYPWKEVFFEGRLMKMSVRVDGKSGATESREIELFRASVLAKALDRTKFTLKAWEDAKLFSKPTIRIKESPTIRYYTAAQVINIYKIWAYKYRARSHPSAEALQAMLADFREVMKAEYLDRYIVDDDGRIDPSREFRTKQPHER